MWLATRAARENRQISTADNRMTTEECPSDQPRPKQTADCRWAKQGRQGRRQRCLEMDRTDMARWARLRKEQPEGPETAGQWLEQPERPEGRTRPESDLRAVVVAERRQNRDLWTGQRRRWRRPDSSWSGRIGRRPGKPWPNRWSNSGNDAEQRRNND